MKIIYQNDKEVKIPNWPLAVDLFVKWGYDIDQERIAVKNMDDVTSELSIWGIPWKWI